MLEFDTICGEGKNRNGNINMKTLMKTAMKTIMKSSLCALAALFIASPALADVLDTTLFSKKSDITVSGYAGSTTLANFPVLVRLEANSPSGFATSQGLATFKRSREKRHETRLCQLSAKWQYLVDEIASKNAGI